MTKEERDPWDLMAIRDKARFRYEMAHYTGPLKVLKGTKVKKDPNAPKRPTSAFLAYSKAKRDAVMAENPTLRATDVSVILSEMWKDEDPAVKKRFMDQIAALREDYNKQLSEHKQAVASETQKRENEATKQAMEAGFCDQVSFPVIEPVHNEPQMDPMGEPTAEEADIDFIGTKFDWDSFPLEDNPTCIPFKQYSMQQQQQPPVSVSPTQEQQRTGQLTPPPSFGPGLPFFGRAVTDQSQQPRHVVMYVVLSDSGPHHPSGSMPTGSWLSGNATPPQQYQTVAGTSQGPAFWGGFPHPMSRAANVTPEQAYRQVVMLPDGDIGAQNCVPQFPHPKGMPSGHLPPSPPNLNNLPPVTPPSQRFMLSQMRAQQQQQNPAPWTVAWSSSSD